jgi:hypothetical protein
MEGWIKIHRKILNHWVFKDAEKYRAWTIILMDVNHSSKKVNIGNLLLTCDRGESLNSLETWVKMFGKNWNKSKVRRFFKLLESDSMIVLKSERKTTRLTVCKYDDYQETRNTDETQTKRKRNANETQMTPNKNDKNVKNVKNVKNDNNNIKEIYDSYPSKCQKRGTSTGKCFKDKDRIKKLLKTHDKDYILKVIDWYIKDCQKTDTYIKNFSTFLNNFPDLPEQQKPEKKEDVYKWDWIGQAPRTGTREQYLKTLKVMDGSGVEVRLIEPKTK